MKTIGVINGPNLDRLGKREPDLYGNQTLKELEKLLENEAKRLSVQVLCFQSNKEGNIIDKINEWANMGIDGGIINPAAYGHTSIGIADSLKGAGFPFIEVHITNIFAREPFRQFSHTAGICKGIISGLGFEGYLIALRALTKSTN